MRERVRESEEEGEREREQKRDLYIIFISTYIILLKEPIGRFPKIHHQTLDDNVSSCVDGGIARGLK